MAYLANACQQGPNQLISDGVRNLKKKKKKH